ncbi:UDP-N-acetylmuramate dehydrogenase [Acutalibacter sp. 1XD8-33]|nr:UDP-N-acetylmuramate dehydrogenase [Acutalibacter sp. 1XD8-33]
MDDIAFDQEMDRLCCENLAEEPLAPHTTFKIGGPAHRFVIVKTTSQLAGVLKELERQGIPRIIIGKGSDLLISDRGFSGAAVCLGGEFQEIALRPDQVSVRAGAAAPLASVCAFARDHGLSGLEFAWGIPGSVGGAVYMNAGAYGGEMKDVIVRTEHWDSQGHPGTYGAAELDFSYRHSRYTESGQVIAFGEFRLIPGDPREIGAKMEELMARRKEKQPYDMPSAGSVFKRPKTGYAAALIDQCGLKGRSVGGAQVSEKHAGFIVNTGGATCRDVTELMELVRETVWKQTGVELEPEVRIIGDR